MTYETALTIARQAINFLEEREGSMTHGEVVLHVAALDLATKVIAKRNAVEVPA
jgi:hypothetical protein